MADPVVTPAPPAVPPPTRAQRLEAMLAEAKPEAPKPEAPAPKPEVKAAPKPEAPKPEAPKPEGVPDGVPDRIKQSFEKLAVREATFRKEQEAVKPYIEALKVLSPVEASAVAKAKASGDPLAVLTALGFSYADVANRMVDLSQKKPDEKAKPAEAKPPAASEPVAENAEIASLRKELDEMKAWRAQQQQESVMQRVKAAVKDKPLISKLNEEGMVLSYMQDFFNRTGKLPGETFEESVAVAAEAVEQYLKGQAKRYAGLAEAEPVSSKLTKPNSSATVEADDQNSSTGPETSGQQVTITNAETTSPRDGARKSREERFKEILGDPNVVW